MNICFRQLIEWNKSFEFELQYTEHKSWAQETLEFFLCVKQYSYFKNLEVSITII